jgi:YggT family protein
VIFGILFGIINYLIWIIIRVVIVQLVLSLLITLNVVNLHNRFVAAVWHAVNAILEPIMGPVRRRLPNTGGIDFSPMVVIIGLNVLQIILRNLALGSL